MIRKLLCWLGLGHEWKSLCAICWNESTDCCEQEIIYCKHCGKVKK